MIDGAQVFLTDDVLRNKLLLALTQGNRLHVDEVASLVAMLQRGAGLQPDKILSKALVDGPEIARNVMLKWSARVLAT